MGKERINVVFISDEQYALGTGVAISSLKTRRSHQRDYAIFIIANQISDSNCKLLEGMSEQGFTVEIISASNIADYSKQSRIKTAAHVSVTALYKFNIPEVLGCLDKALYMDGDIIIRDNLTALYDIDISGCYAAVCEDIGAEEYPAPYNRRLKINHEKYFNTGVMLLNLKLLREESIPQKLLDYREHGINHYMDQDAFNVVFNERVKYFSFLYNMAISAWVHYPYDVLNKYYRLELDSKEEYYTSAKVLHFSSPEKPWSNRKAIGAEEWLSEYVESPFRRCGLLRAGNTQSKYRSEIEHEIIYTDLIIEKSASISFEEVPLVSVVIPVYNAEEYLGECVESLLAQTLYDAEFIFVDDGSSDNSLEILRMYQKLDKRISIYTQKNQYAGVARNNGVRRAKGRYITFLDSDDVLLPDALELLYKRITMTSSDIVICSAYRFATDYNQREVAKWCLRREFAPSKAVFSPNDCKETLFQISAGAAWGKIYRRSFLEENGIVFPALPRSEDFSFVYWAFCTAQRIALLRAELYLYRIIDGRGNLEDAKDRFPLASVEGYRILWKKLGDLNKQETFKKTFINVVINGTANHLRTFKTAGAFEDMVECFKTEMIPKYDIDLSGKQNFYFAGDADMLREICAYGSADEFLLKKYRQLVRSGANNKNEKSAALPRDAYQRNEAALIRASWSYRIGRFITWPYRMVRGFFRCYREHGWRYTWKRVLVHLFPPKYVELARKTVWCYRDHGFQYTWRKVLEKLHLKKSEWDVPHQAAANHTAAATSINQPKPVKKDYDYYKNLPQEQYVTELCAWFKRVTGETLNLENPKTFNEKIQWMKLYDSTPLKTRLADKYLVRDWVKEKIGEEYLIPLLGVWDSFDEIDFDQLPNQFVLKANHGSGWNIIVKDKSKFDKAEAKKKFDLWMSKDFSFIFGFELHYMNIPRKIIAEEYKEEFGELYDYKFMCFDGEVKFIWVDVGRFSDHRRALFTTSWEQMDKELKWKAPDKRIEKPKQLDKMLQLAKKLSEGFAHVRVDFYEVDGVVYFGEMTFTSSSGTERATPKEFEVEMGNMLTLPEKSPIPEKLF